MNVKCRYVALPVNLSSEWCLTSVGLSDHRLWLTGWADICIAHSQWLSLIPLAVPHYHNFFMQPDSQDSLYKVPFPHLLSPETCKILLKWLTNIWDIEMSIDWETIVSQDSFDWKLRESCGCLFGANFIWIQIVVYDQRLLCRWRVGKNPDSLSFMGSHYVLFFFFCRARQLY